MKAMFSHIMLGASDVETSLVFYDAALGALGLAPAVKDPKGRYFYVTEGGIFAITAPIDHQPATHANGSTIGFAAESPAAVDAWHAAGLANGGSLCEDPPGLRQNGMYVGYLRDPAGNKICALYR